MDWIDGKKGKSITIERRSSKKDTTKKYKGGYSKSKLLTREELYCEENHYIKEEKLHLIVLFKEEYSEIDDAGYLLLDVKNKIDEVQFGEVFNSITSEDVCRDEITFQTADGVKLKALKQIISKRSTVLATMIETDMKEKSTGVAEIFDFSGKVMKEVLRFMYVGKVDSLGEIDTELYKAAKVYQVGGLADICLMSIKSRIDPSNVFKILEFADVHDEVDLFDTCGETICR